MSDASKATKNEEVAPQAAPRPAKPARNDPERDSVRPPPEGTAAIGRADQSTPKSGRRRRSQEEVTTPAPENQDEHHEELHPSKRRAREGNVPVNPPGGSEPTEGAGPGEPEEMGSVCVSDERGNHDSAEPLLSSLSSSDGEEGGAGGIPGAGQLEPRRDSRTKWYVPNPVAREGSYTTDEQYETQLSPDEEQAEQHEAPQEGGPQEATGKAEQRTPLQEPQVEVKRVQHVYKKIGPVLCNRCGKAQSRTCCEAASYSLKARTDLNHLPMLTKMLPVYYTTDEDMVGKYTPDGAALMASIETYQEKWHTKKDLDEVTGVLNAAQTRMDLHSSINTVSKTLLHEAMLEYQLAYVKSEKAMASYHLLTLAKTFDMDILAQLLQVNNFAAERFRKEAQLDSLKGLPMGLQPDAQHLDRFRHLYDLTLTEWKAADTLRQTFEAPPGETNWHKPDWEEFHRLNPMYVPGGYLRGIHTGMDPDPRSALYPTATPLLAYRQWTEGKVQGFQMETETLGVPMEGTKMSRAEETRIAAECNAAFEVTLDESAPEIDPLVLTEERLDPEERARAKRRSQIPGAGVIIGGRRNNPFLEKKPLAKGLTVQSDQAEDEQKPEGFQEKTEDPEKLGLPQGKGETIIFLKGYDFYVFPATEVRYRPSEMRKAHKRAERLLPWYLRKNFRITRNGMEPRNPNKLPLTHHVGRQAKTIKNKITRYIVGAHPTDPTLALLLPTLTSLTQMTGKDREELGRVLAWQIVGMESAHSSLPTLKDFYDLMQLDDDDVSVEVFEKSYWNYHKQKGAMIGKRPEKSKKIQDIDCDLHYYDMGAEHALE